MNREYTNMILEDFEQKNHLVTVFLLVILQYVKPIKSRAIYQMLFQTLILKLDQDQKQMTKKVILTKVQMLFNKADKKGIMLLKMEYFHYNQHKENNLKL